MGQRLWQQLRHRPPVTTDAQAAGKDLLLDIDVQGAAQVRRNIPDAVSIFVLPPTPGVLAQRLRERSRSEGSTREDEINRRLAKARGEIENYRQYRYILVNDILDQAVESLTAIVITERARRDATPQDPETERMIKLAEKCRQANATDRLYPCFPRSGCSICTPLPPDCRRETYDRRQDGARGWN